MPLDFAADGAFVAVKLFGDFGDGAVAGQVLDMVPFVLGQLCIAHGNLSCRKGRMLPHTGLFLLWKVALQMRIRHRLKTFFLVYRPLKLKVHAAGEAASHLRSVGQETAVGVNRLIEQVVGFDVPIPLTVAGAAAIVCAEVEHMVSKRARFVAGEFVLGKRREIGRASCRERV